MKKIFRSKKTRRLALAFLLVLLIIAGTVGFGYSKYRTQVLSTDRVTYTNRLAESFRLLEYIPEQKPDGSYTNKTETDTSAEYYRIPGTVITQAPWLEITEKTDVESYLYLEVVESGAEKAAYELADSWSPLMDGANQITGRNGGRIYVYTDSQGPLALTSRNVSADGSFRADILKEGISLDPVPVQEAGRLEFCGYLIQTVSGKTPAEVFNAVVNPASEPEPETQTNP